MKRFTDLIKEMFSQDEIADTELIQDDLIVASCVVLMEIAYSDKDFSESERRKIIGYLTENRKLSESEAEELIKIGEKIVLNDTNKWKYMNLLNEQLDQDKKFELLKNIWNVIYADGKVDKWEEYVVRRIANVLHVPHHRFIQAKIDSKESSND